MDGIVTQRLIDTALSKNVKLLIAARIGKIQVKPLELTILTYNELFT
jgi:DNA primase